MTSAVAPTADLPPSRIGRFELRHVLGKGAQATVWLALDTRLDREVALKLLAPGADQIAVHQWLHEAQAVSRLAHPHLVPVFEADEIDGQGALVFEFVDGPTLSQQIRARGAHAPEEAVQLMTGVLDALAAAHAAGIVHRDLKPSNILIGRDGRARVMDFGIAARVAPQAGTGGRGGGAGVIPASGDGRIVGTPGYLSPEAARGEAPVPAMDVFAAGMVLAELLGGQPLLRERDPWAAVKRVQHEDFRLPASVAVDEHLREIVNRALARTTADRYPTAAAMHRALAEWARPAAVAAEAGGAGGGTLEFLLRRMKRKSDFPALSTAVTRIQRIASSEGENLHSLAAEILKDVALTHKLLRMVNSAHFAQAGAGGVSTISRAVALVGFAGIRNMALSILLLDHLQDKEHARQLKDEFLRALMAGQLASEISPLAREAEEVFIASMLRNLGRLLTGFYFPEEAQQIRAQLVAAGADEALASARVLGISFEELGAGVARHWGLPDALQLGMRKPAGEPPARLLPAGTDRLRWTATAANEVAHALMAHEGDAAAAQVAAIAERHARALGVTPAQMKEAVGRSREKLVQLAAALQIDVAAGSPARRLLQAPAASPAADADGLAGLALQATQTAPLVEGAPSKQTAARPREQVALMLSAGVQDITNSMVDEHFKLNEVLRMVLETMVRALAFQRVMLLLRDPRADSLVGRFGLGERAAELAPHCRVALKLAPGSAPDLFTAVCLKGADTLISDATVASIRSRIPPWHHRHVGARAFVLLPMALKGTPFGLIYADKAEAGAIELDEKELNLLRTLRNQAVMAFRQKG